MKVYETPKFRKQRDKLHSEVERQAVKEAILEVIKKPLPGKKMKGEFKEFRRHKYSVQGQERRLIYKFDNDEITLVSFGPRQGIYK